eukprot:gnl/Trimastix_PCT/3867.p1 GENE.gnl/Trimastix_PCT/3867~~gnl/Trimastix_PCT/3867.p1  ORF type:complete len:600 (+),score=237.63 gnl/Trimastix_PCT/3867:171-1802(+)
MQVDNPQYTHRITKLQTCVKYEQDDIAGARNVLDSCMPDDPDVMVNTAALLYKEGRFDEARQQFIEAIKTIGYQADLAYNVALCHYRMKQYTTALRHIADIIDRGVQEHPELSVGSNTEGIEVRSVGNSQTLHETAMVEAFNLRAAIDYDLRQVNQAREALWDMPPRSEEELDPVTLHNQGLMNMEQDPDAGFKKLRFLIGQPPFPPESFANLLLLCCQHEQADMAHELMAENPEYCMRYLSPELREFIEGLILRESSPEEAYRKFDALATKHIDEVRKMTKVIQDAKLQGGEMIPAALKQFDEALERYIPVLMAMARIYWDMGSYNQVAKLFKQSSEYCSDNEVWKLNLAHVFFMQENYREAIKFYDPVVDRNIDNLLDVTPIVLANLCVSHIMNNKNDQAEEIMRRIEKEEETAHLQDNDRLYFHHCIVNLVIGTLYCSKNNFEFGVTRVMKSLEPISRKINCDTWYYAKRCFCALADLLAKHVIMIKDSLFEEILAFFDAADTYGQDIYITPTRTDDEGPATVSDEARILKRMFLRLRDC